MSRLALYGGNKVIEETGIKNMDWQIPELFADEFAEYVGAKYALTVSSGQAALHSALLAAQIGPGDEVIVPSFTWYATVAAIIQCGAMPVFADIDKRIFTLSRDSVKEVITEDTKAVVVVDIYGHPADILWLRSVIHERDLILIEDASQATGAKIAERMVGSMADITCFSFSRKPITSTSGGILTTNSGELYERAALVGQHPRFLSRVITIPWLRDDIPSGGYGYSYRPDLSAMKIAREQLKNLDDNNDARIKNANYLTSKLNKIKGIECPFVRKGYKHVYHYYTCLFDSKLYYIPTYKFIQALRAEGLDIWNYMNGSNYLTGSNNIPINIGPLHKRYPFKHCELPNTEFVSGREFSLTQVAISKPHGTEKMDQYIEAVNKVIDNIDELRVGA